MTFLKRVLLVIGVVVALGLIAALFVNKECIIEREIVINKPKQEVFDYVKMLKNQDDFSKWASMDPDMKKSYSGTDGAAGFVSAWESNKDDVGKGEQEIKSIEEGRRIDYELRFKEPMAATAPAYMITETVGENATNVTWGLNSKMNYPMNLMYLFMDMDKMIGDDLAIGFNNLKANLEKE